MPDNTSDTASEIKVCHTQAGGRSSRTPHRLQDRARPMDQIRFRADIWTHFRGAYKAWEKRPQIKDDFLAAACRIITSATMYQFASIVPHAVFAKVNENHCLKEHVGNEYALAGFTCALKMRNWAFKRNSPQPFEVVFEDGTAKGGNLVDAMRWERFAEPIFRASKPNDTGGLTLFSFRLRIFWPTKFARCRRMTQTKLGLLKTTVSLCGS
jgi:hypothetical protein